MRRYERKTGIEVHTAFLYICDISAIFQQYFRIIFIYLKKNQTDACPGTFYKQDIIPF